MREAGYRPRDRRTVVSPPSSSRIVRRIACPPPAAYTCCWAQPASNGNVPSGLGRKSAEAPLLYASVVALDPSPKSQVKERSSDPASEALAESVMSFPTKSGSKSPTDQVHVSGCCTLKLCWIRPSEPSSNRTRSHTGLSPFGCPFTGSSSGVYTRVARKSPVRSIVTSPDQAVWLSGLPGIRTTPAVPATSPFWERVRDTSCHFSPATRIPKAAVAIAWTSSRAGATFAIENVMPPPPTPPSSSMSTRAPGYAKSSPYVWVIVNVPVAAGGSWLDSRVRLSISPVPQSTNAVCVSSQPGSENVTVYEVGAPSNPPSTTIESMCGGAFAIRYAAVAVAVSSLSETSTVTLPLASSPNVSGGETAESCQSVSHVPSLSKSHRNWRWSPSGSDEVLASNVIGVPSTPVYGPPKAAVGALFSRNTSTTGTSEWASTVPSASVSTSARGISSRPGVRWGLSSW